MKQNQLQLSQSKWKSHKNKWNVSAYVIRKLQPVS